MAKRILLVEDFDDVRAALRIVLEHQGHNVVEASDGLEAVYKARRLKPDLILMDMAMPGFDGIEAALKIRSNPLTSKIPIIGVTNHGENYKMGALAVGCNEVIDKTLFMVNIEEDLARIIETYV